MMKSEFEQLTKIKVTTDEYKQIEADYMANNLTKQEFCKRFKKAQLLEMRLVKINELEAKLERIRWYAEQQKVRGDESYNNPRNKELSKTFNESDPRFYPYNNRIMGLQQAVDMGCILEML
jgi:hypothetical protein